VVIAKEDNSGNKRLVAYVVPQELFNKDSITSYLKEKLPEYMVPGLWVEMESLPLTSNGKINKKALPDPDSSALSGNEYIAPAPGFQSVLAEIWKQLLDIERVGIHDNFFELGGHSLLAIRVLSAVRKQLDVELIINDVFDYPTIAELSKHLENQSAGNVLPSITAVEPRPELIPLSFSQERLWFIDQLEGTIQYHVPVVLTLKGTLVTGALTFALQAIINRHEVLRTVIRQQPDGKAWQKILDADTWQLEIVDGSTFKNDKNRLQAYVHHLISKPFNLAQDHMLRAAMVRLDEQEHLLVVTMHHIASDGWSLSIIVKELVELYSAYLETRTAELTPLQLQYADYAIWQRNYLQGAILDSKIEYWKRKLMAVAPLQLPTDYARLAVQSIRGAMCDFRIDKELSEELHVLSRNQGTSLFMTLLSAFKVLLYRYCGHRDICVGTPVANRPQQDLEGLVGFFVNTLALRSEVNGDSSFLDLLQQVRATTLDAYANQDVPFEKVVNAVVTERDMGRTPLFEVMFVLQNTPDVPQLRLGELNLSRERYEHTTSKFDITFTLTETAFGLQGSVQYCTDLYKEQTIERMISHFSELLVHIVKAPEQAIGTLPMLTDADRHQLITAFNNTGTQYRGGKTIVNLFEQQVIKTPHAVALVFEGAQLSYQKLNERSNQLANYLRAKGINEETLVPICVERSDTIIIAMLGILKAGAAYVPVDPEYPSERIRYMLEDTRASLVITSEQSRPKLPVSNGVEFINLDAEWPLISAQPAGNPETITNLNDLAYVIYTSGSTGNPKGVMIEQRGVINLIEWHNHEYQVSESSRATAMAGVGFDAFGWEVWPYLSAGATIYIIDDDQRLSPHKLCELFISSHITHSFLSTALVPEFINASGS
jgi:non-ribosomal peptide synthetase component F/acyl carrier protein